MTRKPKTPPADEPAATAPPKKAVAKDASASGPPVPVVCLGASAGGLQALGEFLDNVPSKSGAAYVVIHHADPTHKSLMADLLAKHTDMAVLPAEDQTRVAHNHVYIIPPAKYLEIRAGVLHLSDQADRRGTRLPIDRFLRSLALDLGQNAIAVILSGAGSDGSLAIREIKEEGGIVLVQDPDEAVHGGMPRSAIATGAADHIVAVARMPEIIGAYIRHPVIQNTKAKNVIRENAKGLLQDFTAVLKACSPINFDHYKEGTLLRRIERRMALRHMENSRDYLALLRDSPEEAQNLRADLLINVTSFFRDREAFEHLDTTVIDGLIRSHDASRPVRVWVPGCATGEEAYTLAMLFIEKISQLRKDVKLQIFASDVDEAALAVARVGVYPDSIVENITPGRLRRFFVKEDHSYRVTPELRDAIVFANQNILADAPFSKLDLISCRNLMIYLTPEAQDRVLRMFHFALGEGGTLFLGMSETAGSSDTLFQPLSKKFHIYKRSGHVHSRWLDFPRLQGPLAGKTPVSPHGPEETTGRNLAELSQRLLVDHYAPAAVLINAQSEALYFEGPTDKYLRVPTGENSRDILAMARQGLRARLSSVIRGARQNEAFSEGIARVTRENTQIAVRIEAHPVNLDNSKLLLVTFIDQPTGAALPPSEEAAGTESRHLEQELAATKAELRDTIRDFERSTEELKAVNEETMSMNEEFQSTNEELETSKEELQSLNEELTTLNTQLQQKIDDERRISDDLNNLLASSGIATLFLDNDLRIMRFTPATRDIFNLISNDVGRPFSDITGKVTDPDLFKDVETVLATLAPLECEIRGEGGRWFIRRVLPYRTQEGKVSGVVVTFVEVTEIKTLQRQASAARMFSESIVNTLLEPLLVLDDSLTILSVSQSFRRIFGTNGSELVGQNLFSIQGGQWDDPGLRTLIEAILPEKTTVEAYDITLTAGDRGKRDMVLNARRIEGGPEGQELILLAMDDVTERKRSEQIILDREARLSAILDAVPEAIVTIDEQGVVGNFSPGAEAIFGYCADEVIGKNVSMLMPEPHFGQHDGYLKKYLKTGEKKIIDTGRDMDARHKDGSLMPIRLSVSELELDGARHFLGIMHDLTIEKKQQAELHRAQKMEAVGQLTGGLAHDFNNLLTVVIGNLELLEMRTEDSTMLELVHQALEASSLGAALTSHLLSFSKSQSLAPERVALNALVKVMLPILERTIGEHIEIEIRLADDLETTLADPGQIESAILNLAINSRDAMPEGGTITIETRNVSLNARYAASEVDVKPGDYVCLSVSDTGVGMPAEAKTRAFEPFFTTKGPGDGSGLGLSMVYGFAKQSGGHVAIHSAMGEGTTVSLFLPAVSGEVKSKAVAGSENVAETCNETILVVEDDPKVRRLTVARLQELKYQVLEASDGPEAIALVRQRQDIALVLSDVVMPGGMSGFDVADKARALRPDLKVLLATGYAKGVDMRGAGLSENDYAILRKPYGLKELAKALRKLLD